MKILKKFDSYIKEDLATEQPAPSTNPVAPTVEPGTNPDRRDRPSPIRRDRPAVEPDPQAKKFDATEEEGTYIGTQLLRDLADALGSEVVDNAVKYDGKTINFFSETEKFHVDRKKFATLEEVVEYLTGGQSRRSESEKIEKTDMDEMTDNEKSEFLEESIGRSTRKFIDDFDDFEDDFDEDEEFEDEFEDDIDEYDGEFEDEFEDDLSGDEEFGDECCPNCECDPCVCEEGCDSESCEEDELLDSDEETWTGNHLSSGLDDDTAFGMKDDRIEWPRGEEAMESRITKKFSKFK